MDRRTVLQVAAAWVVARPLPAAAPGATVANFFRYVDGGYYDGGRFHRTVRLDNSSSRSAVS